MGRRSSKSTGKGFQFLKTKRAGGRKPQNAGGKTNKRMII